MKCFFLFRLLVSPVSFVHSTDPRWDCRETRCTVPVSLPTAQTHRFFRGASALSMSLCRLDLDLEGLECSCVRWEADRVDRSTSPWCDRPRCFSSLSSSSYILWQVALGRDHRFMFELGAKEWQSEMRRDDERCGVSREDETVSCSPRWLPW